MAARCKRRVTIEELASAVAGVQVRVNPTDVEITIRAVDAAGVAVAWELRDGTAAPGFNFAAGEAYTDERLALDDSADWLVLSAAGGTVQVIRWST